MRRNLYPANEASAVAIAAITAAAAAFATQGSGVSPERARRRRVRGRAQTVRVRARLSAQAAHALRDGTAPNRVSHVFAGRETLGPRSCDVSAFCASRGEEVSAFYQMHLARGTRFLPVAVKTAIGLALFAPDKEEEEEEEEEAAGLSGEALSLWLFDKCIRALRDAE